LLQANEIGAPGPIRTGDLRLRSYNCKSGLLLNQLLAALAIFKTNITQWTINFDQANGVTHAPQR